MLCGMSINQIRKRIFWLKILICSQEFGRMKIIDDCLVKWEWLRELASQRDLRWFGSFPSFNCILLSLIKFPHTVDNNRMEFIIMFLGNSSGTQLIYAKYSKSQTVTTQSW